MSEVLGLRLQAEQGKLMAYRLDTGEPLLTAEQARQAEAEARHAEAEARQAAEAEVARLREELRRRSATVVRRLASVLCYQLPGRAVGPGLRICSSASGTEGDRYRLTAQMLRNTTGLPWCWRNRGAGPGPSSSRPGVPCGSSRLS